MTHPDSQLLSAYLDGDLTEARSQEIENHLAGCPGCRALYRELEEVQLRARSLPDRYPHRDLWPGIARALEGDASEAEVIELHPWLHDSASDSRRRGFRISYFQVAAAVILALFSGGVGAYLASPEEVPATFATESVNHWAEMVGGVTPKLSDTANEVVRLEELLARHESELDPETVRILEDNLGVIDQAIQESLRALRADPGNAFLEGHLARAVESKANFLREATAFVASAS